MWPNPHIPADLVTFTEEILNEKLDFLYREMYVNGVPWSLLNKVPQVPKCPSVFNCPDILIAWNLSLSSLSAKERRVPESLKW